MSIKIKKKTVNDLEEDLSAKVGLFDKLPEFCLTCNAPFDRKIEKWLVHGTLLSEIKKQLGFIALLAGTKQENF